MLTSATSVLSEQTAAPSQDEPSDRTIMPRNDNLVSETNVQEQMDELQRMINSMQTSESLGSPESLGSSNLGRSSCSLDAGSSNNSSKTSSSVNLGEDILKQSNMFSHTSSFEHSYYNVPVPPRADELEGNLEVLQYLGEGTSGEVSKARVKTTGFVVACKVRAV